MIAQTKQNDARLTSAALRRVAVIGSYAHHHLHDVLQGVDGYDVVFVESMTHAFSKIKRVHPDLVVLCVSSEDEDGCRVLSMLALDDDTARIPVVTRLVSDTSRHAGADLDAELSAFGGFAANSLN
jgi:CheY-like chemotaxis protein